ncbi:unnamed protein product [Macrosiphum euphorbiae]|uniref:Uncharacterized protein n=1 Tax=Macrosiphum euphorbiae TaxID=13131 RepID=A0AAV0Y2A1_9HEMI|nr:unnamed protein product [Macrosiphum euphorbiae]
MNITRSDDQKKYVCVNVLCGAGYGKSFISDETEIVKNRENDLQNLEQKKHDHSVINDVVNILKPFDTKNIHVISETFVELEEEIDRELVKEREIHPNDKTAKYLSLTMCKYMTKIAQFLLLFLMLYGIFDCVTYIFNKNITNTII